MADLKKEEQERLGACVDLIGRSGSTSFELRYSDDEEPTVWMAIGKWGDQFEAAGGMSPLRALVRLLEAAIDGGTCKHCERPTSVSDDWRGQFPLENHICWYVYDPEMKTFRRGCEGERE